MSHVTQPVKLSPPVTQSAGERVTVAREIFLILNDTYTVPINDVTFTRNVNVVKLHGKTDTVKEKFPSIFLFITLH